MVPIKTSHVDGPTLAERFGLLSSVISENFSAPWRVEPIGPEHKPALLSWACTDGVAISRAEMSPSRLWNPGTKRPSDEKFYLCASSESTTLRVEGSEPMLLEPEEFIVLNSSTPSEWVIPRQYTTSSLIIDRDLFHECLPEGADYVGQKLALPFGLNSVLSCKMESAWEITRAGLLPQVGPKLVRSFLDTLSLVPRFSAQPPACAKTTFEIRRKQIKSFIDKNFASPSLSVALVAERLRLSPRYIQMVFAADGHCPSEYLRNVRLSACARLLRDTAHSRRSITQVSFDCGFNSSAHFSTEFRRSYGMTPRDYRRSGANPNVKRVCLDSRDESNKHESARDSEA